VTLELAEGLELIRLRASENRSLAVVVTSSEAPDPQISVANATIIDHPITGQSVVAFVSRRGSKLRNLRTNRRATLLFQAGWEWVATRGDIELSGPDDPHPAIHGERQQRLLRDIYSAAGGSHPDLDQYDQTMLDERRCAVLLTPEHIWTNPAGSEHKEPGTLT